MIFIPGNVPSLKNSKVKTRSGIFSSPAVNRYCRALGVQAFSSTRKTVKGYVDVTRPNEFEAFRPQFEAIAKGKEFPLVIGYHQVRGSKRLFDFSNSVELIQDLFTAHDFIEDDNVRYVFPVPMYLDGTLIDFKNPRKKDLYSVDKHNPGVWINIF